mmetsp:Transcript_10080/g.15410  ORF Transcript_10080/g.15410 Transcript_10080/m.15410 type:complete len:92 (+) Transcript_10080:83-358(+)|eukprot:CAMPEP_0170511118 /NCGR_PEP_ID=MMETSP0208-20121228/66128_1 /TAXON_ID=197538 /ORGANISM="Strombidium inclinatum, Strain S3" /LENGTH=91 /DNA_ID=CAMNT_0010794623 /DNA_START=65 /DNA_END=340 /DNA_ORIENTATION=+
MAEDKLTIVDDRKQKIWLKGSDRGFNHVINTFDFYRHSSFLIDTLKTEFCEAKPQGWFEFKEPLEIDDGDQLMVKTEEAGHAETTEEGSKE